jgi:pilus assembly protein CpaF
MSTSLGELLTQEALRMRLDRLIVGELREAKSLDLLIALNSGMPLLAKGS